MGRLLAMLVLVLAAAGVARAADERVALVIGNADYASVAPLENPLNDARDIGAALARLGFEVTVETDLGVREMSRALRDFAQAADGADMAILYFAGHGLEIDNANYLIPTDARIESARDVIFEATAMDQFLRSVEGARTLRLVLLDACRNNPFLARIQDGTRAVRRGLAQIEPPGGVLVGYAARGGTAAMDGDGRNSPYARAILEHIETPGIEIGKLFRLIRDSVFTATGGQQEPFTYGSLPARDIFLALPVAAAPERGDMLLDFARADIENTTAAWQDFIARAEAAGADPALIARARQRLAALGSATAVTVPAPAVREADSPLIRACDGMAADPADPDRPEGVPGVKFADIDTAAALTACKLAVAGHPGHARSLYQLGRVHRAMNDTPAALDEWERAGLAGHTAATVAAATILLEKNLKTYDPGRAVPLLSAAVESGSPVAPRLLAEIRDDLAPALRDGLPTVLDLYLEGAARGDAQSQYRAGYRLVSMVVATPEDRQRGIALLEAATAQGEGAAAERLATFHAARGDRAQEEKYYLLAAQTGARSAIAQLAKGYRPGGRFPTDPASAAMWTRWLADHGNTQAMIRTGYDYELGRGFERSPSLAAIYYVRAIEHFGRDVIRRRSDDWDKATAQAVQLLLRTSRGRYSGPIDGDIGPGTRAAMLRLCRCGAAGPALRFADSY